MVVSEFNLLAAFHCHNEEYFDGVLPIPNLVISHSYRTLGYFHCDVDEYGNYYNETIEISDSYDYTEEQFRDIMIHEMIHYYLLYVGLDTKCTHGKEFKKMMDDFNIRYGFNITKKIDLSSYKIKKGNSKLMFKLCTFF